MKKQIAGSKSAGAKNSNQALSIACLEAVHAVAATGSMSLAAKRLSRTQSAISQLIATAELSLGCPLFDRSTRPLKVSEPGREIARHAARILGELTALPKLIANRQRTSTIRIAMIDSFANTLGADLASYAGNLCTDLFISQGLTPTHVNDLLERRVDIIVSADVLDEHDGLARYPLLKENFVVLVPETGIRLLNKIQLQEIASKLPFIRYSSRSTTGAMIERYMKSQKIQEGRRIEVDNADMMCSMVTSGMGWAITTPLHVLQGLSRLRGVAVLNLPAQSPERQVTLIAREGEFEEIAARLAVQAIHLFKSKYLPVLFKHFPGLTTQANASPTSDPEAAMPFLAGMLR